MTSTPATSSSYIVTDSSGIILSAYKGPAEGAPTGSSSISDTIFLQIRRNITGFTYSDGVLTPITPAHPPEATLAEQAAIALNSGVTINTTGSITLTNLVFPCDAVTTAKIAIVLNIYNATGSFPNGNTTYDMKDFSGNWHTLTGPQYMAITIAISNYAAPLYLIVDGHPGLTTLPNPVIPTLAL